MTKAIEVFVPGLPSTPGWTSLSQERRDWLLERTESIAKYRRQQAVGAVGEARELARVQAGLEGTSMKMGSYLSTMYGKSERTAWKRLQDYRELQKVMPEEAIDALVNNTDGFLAGSAGLGAGDVIRAAKALPPPKSKEPKVIEGYLGSLREKLKEERRTRRAGHRRLDPDDGIKMVVLLTRKIFREAKIATSAEGRAFLRKMVGYIMEDRAIPGSVTAERTIIPDGFMPRRGRPRKVVKVA